VSLETDVFWPSDSSGEVSNRLDVTTNSVVSGSLLEKRVLLNFIRSLGGLSCLNFLSLDLKQQNY